MGNGKWKGWRSGYRIGLLMGEFCISKWLGTDCMAPTVTVSKVEGVGGLVRCGTKYIHFNVP